MKMRWWVILISYLVAGWIAMETSAQNTVEWVCEKHPGRIKRLFAALDLDRKGLEDVRSAVGKSDWQSACRALLEFYRNGTGAAWLRPEAPKPGTGTIAEVEKILADTMTFYELEAKVPRKTSGGLDWMYRGPNNDIEWTLALNRHNHVRQLFNAYLQTGNPAYARGVDAHVRDWILSNPYTNAKSVTPAWRGLEVHSRLVHWAPCFYGLMPSGEFTDATRLLMLASIPEHADYHMRFHAAGGNWLAMEMNGLATAAVSWPEFKDAEKWLAYAVKRLAPEIKTQVYPDGVQKELTSHYHWVTLRNFEMFAETVRRAGRALPDDFAKGLEGMWNYLAYAMNPDGHGPLNNDSDRDDNRDRVLKAADDYNRPDWKWIASNGAEGKPPKHPSAMFPWAGQVVMRNNWQSDAHWAFFDIGPWGIGHQHNDKLHLSIAAHGRDLLVDGGRYSYKGDAWRRYFLGSASHNTILVNGAGQNGDDRSAAKPLDDGDCVFTPEFDFARGSFTKGYSGVKGKVVHTRAVLYVRGKFWVVVDRIETDQPRDIQALWHFHPECTVAVEGATVASNDADKGNLRIVPVSKEPWKVELVKGQTKPNIQGWWSEKYNAKVANPTAVYSAHFKASSSFVWILVPSKGAVPTPRVALLDEKEDAVRVRVESHGDSVFTVTVPLKTGKPLVESSKLGNAP